MNRKISHCRTGISGFTMIEMMIVIVLIGILAAIATPMFFRAIPRLKSRTEARNILSMVRTARSRAISESAQYGVYFDTNARRYLLFKDIVNPSLVTYEVGDSILGTPVNVDPKVAYTACTFINNCIVLLPTGGASQSGAVTVDATGGGCPYTVSVLAATGRSKLQ